MDYLNYIDYRENDGGTLKIKIKPLLRFSRKLIFINITILTCTYLHPIGVFVSASNTSNSKKLCKKLNNNKFKKGN